MMPSEATSQSVNQLNTSSEQNYDYRADETVQELQTANPLITLPQDHTLDVNYNIWPLSCNGCGNWPWYYGEACTSCGSGSDHQTTYQAALHLEQDVDALRHREVSRGIAEDPFSLQDQYYDNFLDTQELINFDDHVSFNPNYQAARHTPSVLDDTVATAKMTHLMVESISSGLRQASEPGNQELNAGLLVNVASSTLPLDNRLHPFRVRHPEGEQCPIVREEEPPRRLSLALTTMGELRDVDLHGLNPIQRELCLFINARWGMLELVPSLNPEQ